MFDNDGTLWCEKPMPIELGFILERLAAMAEKDDALRDRQPWKAAHENDHAWLGGAITKHYQGDDARREAAHRRRHPGVRGHGRSRRTRTRPGRTSASAAIRRSIAGSASAATRRWWSCCATWRSTGSRATSPRAATATSCARSRTTSTHPARADHRQLQRAALPGGGRGRLGRLPRRAGHLRRRPGEAGPHLEPHRAPAAHRGRQRQRRHPVPALRRRGRARRCGCSCSTTTPSASSTTSPAPSRPSRRPTPAAGRSISVKDDWATVFA